MSLGPISGDFDPFSVRFNLFPIYSKRMDVRVYEWQPDAELNYFVYIFVNNGCHEIFRILSDGDLVFTDRIYNNDYWDINIKDTINFRVRRIA